MRSKLGALAAVVVESGWLIALVAVPVYFNPFSYRIFEEDKVPLLRSLSLVMAVGLLVWLAEEGDEARRPGGVRWWRLPLVRPVLALTAVYTVSTLASIVPYQSFWGAYVRAQGTYTWLCYVVVFAAIIFLVRQRQQLDRVVTVILLASVPPSIYSLVQHFGYDPIPWSGNVIERVYSTAGNPIFIGGYIIMVVPLTLARLVAQLRSYAQRGRSSDTADAADDARTGAGAAGTASPRVAEILLIAAYVLLLVLQLLTLVYSQSRGPFVGLCAGLTFFWIVFAVHRRIRWLTLSTAAAVGAGLLFLVTFNLPHTPLEPLREVPYMGRLGSILDLTEGSNKVRTLIWEGVVDLLASRPERAVLGYGPETMFLVYWPHYPKDLAYYEHRGTAPDRSHNETFDALVTIGAVGLLAQLTLFVSFFLHVLQWLGMITTTGQRRAFIAAVLLGAAIGGVLPYFVDGSFRFFGVGVPAGLAAGIAAYLIIQALVHLDRVAPSPTVDDLLLIGLLSAVMAHFVEIHFGIPIAATRLYFFTYAGLAVAIGVPLVRATAAVPVATAEAEAAVSAPVPVLSGALVTVSPVVGLLLIIITYGFYRRTINLSLHAPTAIVMLSSIWIVGALLIAAERGARGDWLRRLLGYTATTIGVWLLFCAIYIPWADFNLEVHDLTPAVVYTIGLHRSHNVTIFYLFVTLILIFSAAVAWLRDRPAGAAPVRRPGLVPLYLGALGIALYLILTTNLRPVRADSYSKQGEFYEQQGRWEAARMVYSEAIRLQPQEQYEISLGRVLMERARLELAQNASERDKVLAQAQQVLEAAQAGHPLNPDHPRNVAKLHRSWSALTSDPAERARRTELADAAYRQASALNPHSAGLMNEWATMFMERSDPARALPLLDRSDALDHLYPTTPWLKANALNALGRPEEAVVEYDRALSRNHKLLAAWSGKALVLVQLGRIDEAIEANKSALEIVPKDVISHRNLAILYRQIGQPQAALEHARAALAAAQPPERPALEAFIVAVEGETPGANGPASGDGAAAQNTQVGQ